MGLLAGVKIGGLAAVGGSILGYTGASVVSEHRELREYIDEHYEKEPQLYVQSPRDDSKRKTSRSLPEVPGQRPLGPAKYRDGPNGYRRPSLVRASSFEQRNVNVRVNHYVSRTSSVEPRGYRAGSGRSGLGEGGTGHRKLPSRPSLHRMGSFDRDGPRRPPLLPPPSRERRR